MFFFADITANFRGLLCVRIKQLHLEQDSGKTVFSEGASMMKKTLVDFNRAGLKSSLLVLMIVLFAVQYTTKNAWLCTHSRMSSLL